MLKYLYGVDVTYMPKNVPNRTKSVSRTVKEVLGKRPFLANALVQDIVNYSALARYVQKEVGPRASVDAIKTALIRERNNLKTQRLVNEESILKVLKNSRIELRDKVAVIVMSKDLNVPYIASSVVSSGPTRQNVYILDQTYLDLKKTANMQITKNLVALTIKSPKGIENASGFVAFVAQLLASNGVNIREFTSCYTDTVIVLTKNEGLKAFNIMQRYV